MRSTVTFISLKLYNSEYENILILNFDKDEIKKITIYCDIFKEKCIIWRSKIFLLENYTDTIVSNQSFSND